MAFLLYAPSKAATAAPNLAAYFISTTKLVQYYHQERGTASAAGHPPILGFSIMSEVSTQKKSVRQRALSPVPAVKPLAAPPSLVTTAPLEAATVTKKEHFVKLDGFTFESKILSGLFLVISLGAPLVISLFFDNHSYWSYFPFDNKVLRPIHSSTLFVNTSFCAVQFFHWGKRLYDKRKEQTTAGRIVTILVLIPAVVYGTFKHTPF
jgi:hypothetical protein